MCMRAGNVNSQEGKAHAIASVNGNTRECRSHDHLGCGQSAGQDRQGDVLGATLVTGRIGSVSGKPSPAVFQPAPSCTQVGYTSASPKAAQPPAGIIIYANGQVAAVYTTQNNKPGTMQYLHRDNLGSTDAITNPVGRVVARFSYHA